MERVSISDNKPSFGILWMIVSCAHFFPIRPFPIMVRQLRSNFFPSGTQVFSLLRVLDKLNIPSFLRSNFVG